MMTGLILIALFGTAAMTALAMAAGLLIGARLRPATERPPPRLVATEERAPDEAVAARIEIADLRIRIKRLEAIAAGVDL